MPEYGNRAGDNVTATELVSTLIPVVDSLYEKESLTSIFERDGVIWEGTAKIKFPKVDVQGNADYSREDGYVNGSISVEYEEFELTIDRGRRFNIDAVTANEFPFDLAAEALLKFERNHNIPEIDAIRFAAIAKNAGVKVEAKLATTEEAIAAFDAAELHYMREGIDMSRAVMYVSAEYYALIKDYMTQRGRLNPNQNNGVINRVVTMLDQTPLIPVPAKRFMDKVELLTGKTGQEAGGFKNPADAVKINFLLLDVDVPQAVTKRKADKVITPDANQTHDGWSFYYRTFHDVYFLDEQKVRMYAHVESATVGG